MFLEEEFACSCVTYLGIFKMRDFVFPYCKSSQTCFSERKRLCD